MNIYPAIDLRSGKCVRLQQGERKKEKVYASDPLETAESFIRQGASWLHVIDLDSAFDEESDNRKIIKTLAGALDAKIQTGGGIRSLEEIDELLSAGVQRVILGTIAVRLPAVVKKAVQRFGPHAIAVAIDARAGRVAVDGWERTSVLDALAFGKKLADYGIELAIYTDIARDGMLSGINLDALMLFLEHTQLQLIASGGVRDLRDLQMLCDLNNPKLDGAILGRSIYEGTIRLVEAINQFGEHHAV